MRVLFDLRCLQTPSPRGGVGVFAEQLVRHLLACDPNTEYLLYASGLLRPTRHLPHIAAPNARWVVDRSPNKIRNGIWTLDLAGWTSRDVDAVFLPNLHSIAHVPPVKLLTVVHDLGFIHFPYFSSPRARLWHHMVRPRKLLHQSDAIITVSKTTARDCMETFNVPPSRIHAVTPGVLPPPPLHRRFIDGTLRKFRIPHRYILALSAMDRRKNLDGLIAAVAQLRHPTALVIAGIPGSTQRALARHIRRSPARNRIHCIGTVSENEKHALLERATCFAYPSHWEGFGFPPLEAFSHGTPVVASAQGALPEILSTNALLVDPLDPTAIARALDRVLNETAVARRLSSSGRTHVDRYQWVGAAKQVRDLIHMTIEH